MVHWHIFKGESGRSAILSLKRMCVVECHENAGQCWIRNNAYGIEEVEWPVSAEGRSPATPRTQ